jgi:DNA replication licensing factor MCM2
VGLDSTSSGGADEDDSAAREARREAKSSRIRRKAGGAAGAPGAPGGGDDDDDDDDDGDAGRRGGDGMSDEGPALAEDRVGDDPDLENVHGSLREWIQLERPRKRISAVFRRFLRTHRASAGGEPTYVSRIRTMCAAQRMSLEVRYSDLADATDVLARWLGDCPREMLEIFDVVALAETTRLFPNYANIHPEIKVRITEVPTVDTLRNIRHIHLNALIRVRGVVTRRSGVYPQLKAVKYDCVKCGETMGPFAQGAEEIRLGSCAGCQSRGPFTVNQEQTVYQAYQRVTLQESPGTVPPGRLPRQKEVVLLADLIDRARPGDEVDLTGVYTNNFDLALNRRNSFPVFATVIIANHLFLPSDAYDRFALSEDDVREIRDIARRPELVDQMIASVAPSIYGYDSIKLALLLSMLGGEAKNVSDKLRLRGDINILLMGDPGTAKSQFLKYVEKTASRAVFTTGQGASAVGLTASVRIDPVTREWTLEGGALVLADRGVCLIDEFDKMNDADRTSIHEAMEQQSISIAKAGIVATLQARCAVIAAANPIKGRYDPSMSFADNVDLTEPILSRFDILCVVRDVVDPVRDEMLANFVVGSHISNHPTTRNAAGAEVEEESRTPISQDMMRKYIVYARQAVKPSLTQLDQNKISSLYQKIRAESAAGGGGMPVTVRFVESILRLCEAHARLRLRDYVDEEDVDAAVRLALETFIGAQKQSVAASLKRSFAQYLKPRGGDDPLLLYILNSLVRDNARYALLRASTRGEELRDRRCLFGFLLFFCVFVFFLFLYLHFLFEYQKKSLQDADDHRYRGRRV